MLHQPLFSLLMCHTIDVLAAMFMRKNHESAGSGPLDNRFRKAGNMMIAKTTFHNMAPYWLSKLGRKRFIPSSSRPVGHEITTLKIEDSAALARCLDLNTERDCKFRLPLL